MSAGSVAAVFGASFALSLSTAVPSWPMPGIVSRESRRHGFFAAIAIAAGQLIPEAFLLLALAILFDQFITSDAIEDALFISGGIVLVWIGVWTFALSMGRGSPFSRAYPAEPGDRPRFRLLAPRTVASLAVGGFAVTLSSFEWFAVWFTARAALIARAGDEGVGDVAAFAAGHWLADLGWLTLIAGSVAAGQRFFDTGAFRALIAASGVGLVGLGAGFMQTGLSGI